MFIRIIKESFARQAKMKILAAIALALGASVATALFNITLDIGDRMNDELKQYGANIMVVPKERALPLDIGGIDFNPLKDRSFIEDKYLIKLREIFWRYNIKGFAPFLSAAAEARGRKVEVVGTWFEKENILSTGETFVEGIRKTRPWLKVEGEWVIDKDDDNGALVNEKAMEALSSAIGESVDVTLFTQDGPRRSRLAIKGIIGPDESEEPRIYVGLGFLQRTLGLPGKVQDVEVSAITTPDNRLSKRAAEDSDSLGSEEFEEWYCTAYVSAVAFQIEEVIPGVSAKPVRKVAEAEGRILTKLKVLMAILSSLALVSSALGIWSLMTTAVLARRQEIGLQKALGAESWTIVGFFLSEVLLVSFFASLAGWGMGLLFSEAISRSVFGHSASIKPVILPVVFLLSAAVAVIGSIAPIKIILKLKPIEVLHGR